MSKHLEDKVHVGDSIMVSGPAGKLKYLGNGTFTSGKKTLLPKKKLGLLAGGTGITPAFSLAQAAVMSNDDLEVSLLFSNKTKDDILIQKDIGDLHSQYADRF